jgi:hypothetical protein
MSFQVDVRHICETVVITKPADLLLKYIVKDPTLVITSLSFNSNFAICGFFTYTIKNSDNSNIDSSVFTFNP